jgi:hypothetical protein
MKDRTCLIYAFAHLAGFPPPYLFQDSASNIISLLNVSTENLFKRSQTNKEIFPFLFSKWK